MRKKWIFLLCFIMITSMLRMPVETKADDAQLCGYSYYTIHFDSCGGSWVGDQTVTYNGTVSYIPTPTRYGYRFAGWYTGINGNGSRLTEWTQFTQNTTYYAYWIYENDRSIHTISYLNVQYYATSKSAGQYVQTSDFYVQAVYDDGYTETITNFSLSSNYLQQGNNTFIIIYGGQSVVMEIYATSSNSYMTSTTGGTNNGTTRTVSYLEATYIRTARRAGEYLQNSDFSVQAVYTDGSKSTITGFSMSSYFLQSGYNSIVISYSGKSITIVIFATTTGSYVTSTTGGNNTSPVQPIVEKETVTVHVNSTVSGSNDFQIEKGKPIQISKPSKKGYEFSGWYTNENCTNEFAMGTTATKETYIFAKMTKYSNMSLSKKNVVLSKGKSTTIKVKGLSNYKNAKWKSSDKNVATVDSKGKITAEGKGSATIYAVLRDGTTRKCYVIVK
ncbi:MAG: InlB B-repeat-containing protein [bacterium]|nr:InlB B-repeat-containing protein [bacterium]